MYKQLVKGNFDEWRKMNSSLEKLCVEEETAVIDGIKKLDAAGEKVLLVTKERKLSGIITDGDIRRWILKRGNLNAGVSEMMHKGPRIVKEGEIEKAKKIMQEYLVEAVPVVNEEFIPIDVIFWRDLIENKRKKYDQINIPVVIMAGGKGTRLQPYTNVLPKPLMPIGNMTILERIIESFRKNGCTDFWLTLNYKKNLIKAYFDEKEKDYKIGYIEEEDYWGTCGSLWQLEGKIDSTFFVSNCDVLLDIDYSELLRFHRGCHNEITVVTALKYMQVPYGVMDLDEGGLIKKITEKPELNYSVNTGIYVMEPNVIEDIPRNKVFHMTDLLNNLIKAGRKVGAFPITEQAWKDMGEIKQMQEMINIFQNN